MALGGVAAPLFLGAAAILAGTRAPGTSHASQFLSELGATGAPSAWIMNGLGLIPAGVLLAAFSVTIRRAFGPGLTVTVGALCVTAVGLGSLVGGVFSCDPGCPETGWSREATIHAWAGLVASIFSGLAPLVVGAGLFRRRPLRGYAIFSIVSGIVTVGLIAVMIADGSDSPWRGAWQRGFLAAFFLWTIVTGLGIASAARAGPES
jgi:hypothetical membrane protein